ncbi:poly(rC)-binding protein 3-like isoform X3 [Planococcus citri]|uniref:poly(rC)-binding protein 3-like isoform X3 n=1 Tax=Planococcus citri TaxID=170843 RepID=UPI0031F85BD8
MYVNCDHSSINYYEFPPTMDIEQPKDDSNCPVTIKILMQGKEVGSIIGKKGEIIKRFREESGAKINISDGTCPERIVAITGTTQVIYKAFSLICSKVEEFQDIQNQNKNNGQRASSIVIKLIIPASQCGSLIGKGGSKIKEIRGSSGASIQVSSDLLPNSTERAVTMTGTKDSVIQCLYHICCVMLESPPKGPNIPYRPKPHLGTPVILTGNQAYPLPGITTSPADIGKLGNPLANLAALSISGFSPAAAASFNPAAIAALAASQLQNNSSRNSGLQQRTCEMTVRNDLIGCIIGKGGNKIAEIRQISGALIRISNCDDRNSNENVDRTITITGNSESVAVAQYLINMSLEQQKLNLFLQSNCSPGMLEGPSDILAQIPSPFTSLPELPQSPVKPANTFDATVPISEYTYGNLPVIESIPLISPCRIEHFNNVATVSNVQEKVNLHKHNRTKYKPY